MLIYLAASSQVNDKFPHGGDAVMLRNESFAVADWFRSFLLLSWLALWGFFLLFRDAGFHRLLLRHRCGFITNGQRETRFFFQIGAHGIQGHLPKQRIIGFPQHGHVLKAGSAEQEIHAVHPKLPAVDMQRSVQGNIIFSEKVFGLLMGAILFFPGQIYVAACLPELPEVGLPAVSRKAGHLNLSAQDFFDKRFGVQNLSSARCVVAVKLIIPMLLKAD